MVEPNAETAAESRQFEHLLSVLVRLQARPAEALSLEQMSAISGFSAGHFHRRFKAFTGETPKQYSLRLRLEHAAYRMVVYQSSVLETALACGFRNHETFTRAFRRRFGVAPRDYRIRRTRENSEAPRQTVEFTGCEISETRVERLEACQVAFIRHLGPYEAITADPWERLTAWAMSQGIQDPLMMGIAHDAPGITPAEKLRFDIAVRLPFPAAPQGDIGIQELPGGAFGVTTHIGPYSTLVQAYRAAFERLQTVKGYRFVGLPSIEIFRTTPVNVDYALHQTDICLPLACEGDPL